MLLTELIDLLNLGINARNKYEISMTSMSSMLLMSLLLLPAAAPGRTFKIEFKFSVALLFPEQEDDTQFSKGQFQCGVYCTNSFSQNTKV